VVTVEVSHNTNIDQIISAMSLREGRGIGISASVILVRHPGVERSHVSIALCTFVGDKTKRDLFTFRGALLGYTSNL
jgi:hypothetical protein